VADCKDGSDELNCHSVKKYCDPTSLTCDNGTNCVPGLYFCNIFFFFENLKIRVGRLICRFFLQTKVDRMCDNSLDCNDGSDEGTFCGK